MQLRTAVNDITWVEKVIDAYRAFNGDFELSRGNWLSHELFNASFSFFVCRFELVNFTQVDPPATTETIVVAWATVIIPTGSRNHVIHCFQDGRRCFLDSEMVFAAAQVRVCGSGSVANQFHRVSLNLSWRRRQ